MLKYLDRTYWVAKRRNKELGTVLLIPLSEEEHTYGRVLPHGCTAIYDCKTQEQIVDLESIVRTPILFISIITDHAVTKGRWKRIGILPLEEELQGVPNFYMPDSSGRGRVKIDATGAITPIPDEECATLERFTVWTPEDMEDRIRDHYEGRENSTLKKLEKSEEQLRRWVEQSTGQISSSKEPT